MRLLVVSQYFWPENFKINDLTSELLDRGHEVTILTGLPNYPKGYIFKQFIENKLFYSNFRGAKIIRVPIITRGSNKFTLALNYLSFAISGSLIGLWKLRGLKFDVIINFAPSPITAAFPGICIRWFKRTPLILWILDLWPESLRAVGAIHSDFILSIIGNVVQFIYKNCDLILVQSKKFVAKVKLLDGTKTRVVYFPSWAEELPNKKSTKSLKNVDPNFFNIMFTGNIGEAQDFESIIDAAEILRKERKIRWLIVGDGRFANSVKSEIKKRSLENTIIMFGQYPLEDMPNFIKKADVLLVSLKNSPVFSLTIPGKIQTYLAAGKPIIGMLNGEGARVIRDSGAGFVCKAGDSRELAKIILHTSHLDSEKLATMGRKGKVYNKSNFNRDFLITKLEKICYRLELKGARK
jgi:colanic acid biosynthesis glycosyl transferase WcaI